MTFRQSIIYAILIAISLFFNVGCYFINDPLWSKFGLLCSVVIAWDYIVHNRQLKLSGHIE